MTSIHPVVRRLGSALGCFPSRCDSKVVWLKQLMFSTIGVDAAPPVEQRSNRDISERTLKLLKRKKVTTLDLGILKRKQKPITMVTAYDYPSAVHVDLAGIDVCLVGDSVAMVEMVDMSEFDLAKETVPANCMMMIGTRYNHTLYCR